MNTRLVLVPASIALAMALAGPPVLAQSGSREQRARDRSAPKAGAARQNVPAQRTTQGRGDTVRPTGPSSDAARGNGSSGTRGYTTSRGTQPPASTPSGGRGYTTPRGTQPPANTPSGTRGYTTPRGTQPPASTPSGTRGYATSRGAPPHVSTPSGSRGYATSRVVPPPAPRYDRGYGHRGHVPYGTYNRNAWRGRVHFGLGLSIFAGNAFAFRFDYGWRPSFAYYYPMRQGLAYGGMSFLLYPDYAEVYIDGQFVGIARDFGGQPVPVAAGYHRIELYAPGFVPVTFDIQVYPGQVVPYHGTLYPDY